MDLHRSLPGVAVGEESAWRLLSADPAVVPVAGRSVPALALPGRALHVALHAAHHGVRWRPPRDRIWSARSLARTTISGGGRRRSRTSSTRSTHSSRDCGSKRRSRADRSAWAPACESSVYARLRASTPPPTALGFEQLARAEGMRRRAAIVWRKLVPPAAFSATGIRVRPTAASAWCAPTSRRPVWIASLGAERISSMACLQRSVGVDGTGGTSVRHRGCSAGRSGLCSAMGRDPASSRPVGRRDSAALSGMNASVAAPGQRRCPGVRAAVHPAPTRTRRGCGRCGSGHEPSWLQPSHRSCRPAGAPGMSGAARCRAASRLPTAATATTTTGAADPGTAREPRSRWVVLSRVAAGGTRGSAPYNHQRRRRRLPRPRRQASRR